jgi:hypothetical protein
LVVVVVSRLIFILGVELALAAPIPAIWAW